VEYLDLPEELRAQQPPAPSEPVIPPQPASPEAPVTRISAFLADPPAPGAAETDDGRPVAGPVGAAEETASAGPVADAASAPETPAAPEAAPAPQTETAAAPAQPPAEPAEPEAAPPVEATPAIGVPVPQEAPVSVPVQQAGPGATPATGVPLLKAVPAPEAPPAPEEAAAADPVSEVAQPGGEVAPEGTDEVQQPAPQGADAAPDAPALPDDAVAVAEPVAEPQAVAAAETPVDAPAEPVTDAPEPQAAPDVPDQAAVSEPPAEAPQAAAPSAEAEPGDGDASTDAPEAISATEATEAPAAPADGDAAPAPEPAPEDAPAPAASAGELPTADPSPVAEDVPAAEPAPADAASADAPTAEPPAQTPPTETAPTEAAPARPLGRRRAKPGRHAARPADETAALVGAALAGPADSEAPQVIEPPVTEVPPMPGPLVVGADGTVVTPVAPEEPAPAAPEAPAGEEDEDGQAAASAAPPYEEPLREAVHRVMRERRDIRNGFRPDPIPHDVLLRVLEAAHTAPSVGYSQPWDFVVIRSAKTRARMHELALRQRDAYAASLPKGRAKQFKELKIEAILETPVNIVVTADRTRGGRHTLGRHTQPQMAPYSAALAVENLWLAARAEGLGVGWVSFFDEREMVKELGLPDHLEVVAYLCIGYVDEFPAEPELAQAGWAKKRPLSWVVHEEEYGRRALPGEEPHSVLQETLRGIRPLDAKALGEAWDRQKRMTKPAGSLGMLEIISAQLCGLSRQCPPPIPEPACVAVFAGDHGVYAQGVTPWPQEVTSQMVANILGGGAVVNAFAAQIGTEVCVVDVGVAAQLPAPLQDGRTTGLLPRKVRPGTGDMTQGPAMTRDEVLRALEVGIETARDLVAAGNKALITGDMGIANTTAAAALIAVFTGEDPAAVTGRGTGIDDETHAHKISVIQRALALHQPDPSDPIGVLAAVGGLEHAAIAGFLLGAASLRTPVILDGVIAGSAALAAKAIAPEVLAACIAGHRSAEPGHKAALAKLGLRPLIDLDLRLGEGTGAVLALPLVQAAARAMHDVATFDSAGVTEKQ
jgi:nicotinate-nucleotide--dimethylbenzimidazole phosphoribosyltransferase